MSTPTENRVRRDRAPRAAMIFLFAICLSGVATTHAATKWFPIYHTETKMLMAEVPLTDEWSLTPEGWVGPGGVRAKDVVGPAMMNVDTNVDAVIETALLPMLRESGNRVIAIEDFPAIAAYDRNLQSQYWQFTPTQYDHAAKGVVYEDDNGQKGVVVVRFTRMRSQFAHGSSYNMTIVEGPSRAFDANKDMFLNAIASTRFNPEQIADYNRREQQKANASQANFNAQQRQRQRQFDSNMARQRQTSDSILDSSMDSWRRQQGMIDSGHQRQVDSIGETTQAYHPGTGETWQVQDGYDRYYMNNSGQYVPTDDAFYNPNMDPNLNNQDWTEVTPDAYYGR